MLLLLGLLLVVMTVYSDWFLTRVIFVRVCDRGCAKYVYSSSGAYIRIEYMDGWGAYVVNFSSRFRLGAVGEFALLACCELRTDGTAVVHS